MKNRFAKILRLQLNNVKICLTNGRIQTKFRDSRFERHLLLLADDRGSGKRAVVDSAGVAQSVEQLICNQQVAGSSPIASSGY
jgi:hypothetical protein